MRKRFRYKVPLEKKVLCDGSIKIGAKAPKGKGYKMIEILEDENLAIIECGLDLHHYYQRYKFPIFLGEVKNGK